MKWEHLRAVSWLRWRLFRNQLRRSGKFNAVLTTIAVGAAAVLSVSLFFVALLVGLRILPQASSTHVLYFWNAAIAAFLFFWMIGVMAELQRGEAISIQKMLYYPISLGSTFFVNYLSSFISLSLVVFLPAMVGVSIASVAVMGPAMLTLFPLLGSFVLAVTAVTYQFRGWLGAMMENPRRRRTIIAGMTMAFILLFQLPNLVNMTYLRSQRDADRAASREIRQQEFDRLDDALQAREITTDEFREQVQAVEDVHRERRATERRQTFELVRYWTTWADLVFPPGWLALGAMSAAEGRAWPGLLGSVGLCLLAAASLRRSYISTLRFYLGEHKAEVAAPVPKPASKATKRKTRLLERRLRFVPEGAAAVALTSLQSTIRAPEVKMALLTPFILVVVFSSSLLAGADIDLPKTMRPLMALGVISMSMISLAQLMHNQFGFDRDGFRALVLSPVTRRDILLGKNLAMAPICLGIGAALLLVLQVLYPLHLTDLAAALLELASVYIIFCLIGNYVSIQLPLRVASGSMRAAKGTTTIALWHFLAALMLMLALAPVGIPAAVGAVSRYFAWGQYVSVHLVLAAGLLGVLVVLYRFVLEEQGTRLQSREQEILAAVCTKNE